MKQKKFLTVYAVLDDDTQKQLEKLQKKILEKYPNGTQTMGIPFHISLGSFPVSDKNELVTRIGHFLETAKPFSIIVEGIGNFNNEVIFASPKISEELISYHEYFKGNYADGFDWHPHITLYCGTQEEGEAIQKEFQLPSFQAQIVGIELAEFFPPLKILSCKF